MKHFLSLLSAVLLLSVCGLNAQIPESSLASIFERLNGDDFDARYAARIELQDFVTAASAPDAEPSNRAAVESQLLSRLESEPLLTTKLWIVRQLAHLGGPDTVAALTDLLANEDPHITDAARATLLDMPEEVASEAVSTSKIETNSPLKETLLPAKVSKSKLVAISTEDSNPSVRTDAFARLVDSYPRKAKSVLVKSLQDEADVSQVDFLATAAASPNKSLRAFVIDFLPEATDFQKAAILANIDSDYPKKKTETVISETDANSNDFLETQLFAALGKVGSIASLDRLLAGIGSRSKTTSEAASDALASIKDPRIDLKLQELTETGSVEEKELAIQAMAIRAIPGTSERITELAVDKQLEKDIREAAIKALETVGTVESLKALISIIVDPSDKPLRRDAQRTLKRMSLRLADPQAAWAAFSDGFQTVDTGDEQYLALILVLDAAPTKEAIGFLTNEFKPGDAKTRSTIMKVLPNWRNWESGYALLDIAKAFESERSKAFDGVGKLILGSDLNFPIEGKFALANEALKAAKSDAERQAVINGFRYSTWRERVHVEYNPVDPDLKAAVLEFAKD